jgi:hypothetical protein
MDDGFGKLCNEVASIYFKILTKRLRGTEKDDAQLSQDDQHWAETRSRTASPCVSVSIQMN